MFKVLGDNINPILGKPLQVHIIGTALPCQIGVRANSLANIDEPIGGFFP